jgi:hypothetical protein
MKCAGSRGLGHILVHTGFPPSATHNLIQMWSVLPLLTTPPPWKQGTPYSVKSYLDRAKLWPHLTAETFMVAPAAWPSEGAWWPFDDPPSPYEVACAFHARPTNARIDYDPCARAELRWWLLGLPPDVLCQHFPGFPAGVVRGVSDLLRNPVFFLWALGSDLAPTMGAGLRWAVGRSIMDGTSGQGLIPSRHRGQAEHDALVGIRTHPWIRAQERNRSRALPIQRVLWSTDFAFPTAEAKYERYPTAQRT